MTEPREPTPAPIYYPGDEPVVERVEIYEERATTDDAAIVSVEHAEDPIRGVWHVAAATDTDRGGDIGENQIEMVFEPIYPPGGEHRADDADTEAWLDSLGDPGASPTVDNTEDLRTIAETSDELARIQARLTEAIQIARAHGRSWTDIALRLGVSRQAARQRYAGDAVAAK